MNDNQLLHIFIQHLKNFRKLYYAHDKWIDLSELVLFLCDKDKSGNITCGELQHLTIVIGMNLTDNEKNKLFDIFNSTKNISIFGYKIFKEETISLKELQHHIKNEISEEQFNYIVMCFYEISNKCSCNVEYKNIIYNKLHPELNEEYDIETCKIVLSDILSHTAKLLQKPDNKNNTNFEKLFEDEWSERSITLEYKLKQQNIENDNLQKTIDDLKKENNLQIENCMLETQKNNLLNKQMLESEQQHIDELNTLNNERVILIDTLSTQLTEAKSTLDKERDISSCIINMLKTRVEELDSITNRHLEAIKTMKKIIYEHEIKNQELTINNHYINEQLIIAQQEIDRVCGEIDIFYNTIKQVGSNTKTV